MKFKTLPCLLKTRYNRVKNRLKATRFLEIGPGTERLPDFETLDILAENNPDYLHDASRPLPFDANTFDLIYASHVLEHFPWYQTTDILRDWTRVLKKGAWIELWVPDGVKICSTFVRAECEGIDETHRDGWYRLNEQRDPCLWASGRLFTYGDGKGDLSHPNWHRALFSERYLHNCLAEAGLTNIRRLEPSEVRGYDHGWINLGMTAQKG